MNSPSRQWCVAVLVLGVGASFAESASATPISFSASGPDATSIQGAVDAFRTALGGPNNGNAAGTQPSGRREISWDGGGAGALATTFPSPMTTFTNRGALITTPGTGFEISGQPIPEFGEINATYPSIFTTFSSPRLFAPLDSNLLDVQFLVPGTTQAAATSGFGAVFADVDLVGATSITFFDAANNSLGTFSVPTSNNGLSFLGVSFTDPNPVVTRVSIVVGNTILGTTDAPGFDVVVMDDFIYGEPSAVPQLVPEPETLLLLGAGFLAAWGLHRRSQSR